MQAKFLKTAALGISLGIAGPAMAVPGVQFDLDGSGGGANVITFNSMDFLPANILWHNTFAGGILDPDPVLYAQGKLSKFIRGATENSALAGDEFTFQLRVAADVAAAGANVTWSDLADTTSYFALYHDTSADSNDRFGCGFGMNEAGEKNAGDCAGRDAGTLILTGSITITGANFTANGLGPVDGNADGNYESALGETFYLDQSPNGDQQVSTQTIGGTGGVNLEIEIGDVDVDGDAVLEGVGGGLGWDPNYFISNPVNAFEIDISWSDQNNLPFSGTDPSDQVVDVAVDFSAATRDDIYGTDRITVNGNAVKRHVNNFDCGTNPDLTARICSFHTQGDANASFTAEFDAPEPASIALLGLGLGLLGFRNRARRARLAD